MPLLKGVTASPNTLIMAFVAIVIGASLVGPLADIVSMPGGNVTGAALAIYGLLTLFFVIIVIMVAVKAIGR
ncbi:unnamed protein product [marine sediment metagenome]|uniref:Uncharacterized protein n=1 Tax=marine sediment metagenome TaxID=412755 RepID=X1AIA3_9ZZZZ